jgi:hypothetical protein
VPAAAAPAAGGGRAPPTRVVAPVLPADLGVFSNAVLLVDKPHGWTSFDACNAIKKGMKRLGVTKARAVCVVGACARVRACGTRGGATHMPCCIACGAVCRVRRLLHLPVSLTLVPRNLCTAALVAALTHAHAHAHAHTGWPRGHAGPRCYWAAHHLHRWLMRARRCALVVVLLQHRRLLLCSLCQRVHAPERIAPP